jgi:ectoine hydroxylase-related dioxygenase (phytanoyl-CoA dioxygenase family)
MGPTLFVLGSNTKEAHAKFNGGEVSKASYLSKCDFKGADLNIGDATLFDSRTIHAGAENRSAKGKRRILFYFSFANSSKEARLENIKPGSLLPEARGKYTLKDFR